MPTESSPQEAPGDVFAGEVTSGGGLFTRNATGLVREISQRDNFLLAALSLAPASVIAVTIFFALSGLPGGNIFLAGLLTIPIMASFAYAFGLMSAVIPRSGGDYTIVSRVLGPYFGLISTFCMVFGGFALSAAGLGRLFDTLGVAPSLQTIGIVAHSHTLLSWGTTMLNSKTWQFVIGSSMFAMGAIAHLGGPHRAKRVWNGLYFASTAGVLFSALVALFTTRSAFAADFNGLVGSYTGSAHTYQDVIATATKAGVNVHPPLSLAATIPVIGLFAGFSVFTWFGSFAAGELRQAGTRRTANRMAGGGVFGIAMILAVCILLFHSYGKPFLTAAFGGGFPSQLGAVPAYFTLTSFQIGSTPIAVLLCISFLCVFPLVATQLTLLTRVFFAWSFDGILPARVSQVSRRRHAPTTAIALCFVLYVASVAWGVWAASSLIQIVVYATVIQLIAMILVGVAAIVLPWRRPELYRASGVTQRIGALPFISVAGAAAAAAGAFMIWVYFHYAYFGLANTGKFFVWTGGTIGAGLLYYVVMRWVKARQGVDLALVYSEIPPE
jgi:basic amino acid/polyamine antiporter, APA family